MVQIVVENIFVMFCFILIGFLLRKKNIMDDHVTRAIAKILVNISVPAAIISAMISQHFEFYRLANMGIILVVSALAFVFFTLFGLGLGKCLKLSRDKVGIYACSIAFGNMAFMGIPIIFSIWGDLGVFYISIINIPFFIFVPLSAALFIKANKDQMPVSKEKFKWDPNLIACVVGIGLYVFQDNIPLAILDLIRPVALDGIGGGPIGRLILQLSQLMTPISMFFIGSSLGKSRFSDISADKSIYILLFVKLFFLPLVMLFVVRLFVQDSTVIGVLVMKTAMPTAALVAVFVDQKNSDTVYSSQIIFVTTIFSLLTIPVITLFL